MIALAQAGAVAILGLALVTLPLFLGGTSVWPRLLADYAAGGAVVVWALQGRPSRALAAAAVVTALTVIQSLPIPGGALRILAPALWSDWSASVRFEDAGTAFLSMDPGSTLVAGARLLLSVLTAIAVADLAATPRFRKCLAGSVALSGVLIWGLGTAFPVPIGPERALLGFVPLAGEEHSWLTFSRLPVQGAGFGYVRVLDANSQQLTAVEWGVGDGVGSYIVSNHFACGLYLTVPMIAALCLGIGRRWPVPGVWQALAALVWFAALATVLVVAKSRAGSLAMLFAATTWLSLVDTSRRWFWSVGALGVFAVAAGAFVVMVGRSEPVREAGSPVLAKAINAVVADPRSKAIELAADLFSKSPLFGIGLGAYGSFTGTSPPHQMVWAFAHNDYAQFLAETGLAGIAAGVIAMAFFAWRIRKSWAVANRSARIVQVAALSGLAGLALHSGFDWNLHVPGNTLIASILLGIAMSPSFRGPAQDSPAVVFRPRCPVVYRITAILLALMAVSIVTLSALEDHAAVGLRKAITAARLSNKNPGTAPDLSGLRDALDSATSIQSWRAANAPLAIAIAHAHLILATGADSPVARANEESAARIWLARARRLSPWRAEVRGTPTPQKNSAVGLVPNQKLNPKRATTS